MGRYSLGLADEFCDAAGVEIGQSAVDVGCGPGALTSALVARLGESSVYACEPSPSFRDECAARCPGVTVKLGRAEEIPYEPAIADHAMAQLVPHFVSDPDRAALEMARVVRSGEIAELFASTGLLRIEESTLQVSCTYSSFDELWKGFLAGVGPAGSYCVSLGEDDRDRLRSALFERLDSPTGNFTLSAVARCAVGRTPR